MRINCYFFLLLTSLLAQTACAQQASPERIRQLQISMSNQANQGEFENAIEIANKLLEVDPDHSLSTYYRRGEMHYILGDMESAVADFDRVIEMEPGYRPQLWQRGLVLYYLDRFEEGADQFVVHRTVNGQDVENAVWHFACVARQDGAEKALKGLMPIEGDRRPGMMEIYRLFSGENSVEDVLEAIAAGESNEREAAQRTFYAHFYIGLYLEAIGEQEKSLEHMKLATAEDNFIPAQALMAHVGTVHLKMREAE